MIYKFKNDAKDVQLQVKFLQNIAYGKVDR